MWHLPQTGLSIIPKSKRLPFKWLRPVNRTVTCAWDLLSFKNSTVLLTESLEKKKHFVCLCPVMKCQYSWCTLHVQSLMTCPATLIRDTTRGYRDYKWVQRATFYHRSAISLPSIPLCPGTYSNCILLLSANIIRYRWLTQTSVELII
jgi:hypothetical protein